MSWTDDRVEILKTMWGEGKSASQIAKELGGVTRNAVIGKVHRLGLSNRATPAKAATSDDTKPKAATKPKARPAKETAAKPEPVQATARPAVPKETPRHKAIIPSHQPLPPQPSNSEISEEALASLVEIEKRARKLTLMQLTERTCKWPIGDPATEDFWFCGHPCKPGKPYCETHVAVAFQPMSSRRDRRASR